MLKLNSYEPLFRKFRYNDKGNTITGFFCHLQYVDLSGNEYYYEDKSGEFRIQVAK